MSFRKICAWLNDILASTNILRIAIDRIDKESLIHPTERWEYHFTHGNRSKDTDETFHETKIYIASS